MCVQDYHTLTHSNTRNSVMRTLRIETVVGGGGGGRGGGDDGDSCWKVEGSCGVGGGGVL